VELMALAEAGVVALRTQRYPLASALDALADLDAGRIHGRAVLVP
jgi:NAD+-dependent secondary alcohol dehydrogenase Adh1